MSEKDEGQGGKWGGLGKDDVEGFSLQLVQLERWSKLFLLSRRGRDARGRD